MKTLRKAILPATVLAIFGSMNAVAHLPGEPTPHAPPPSPATVGEAWQQYMDVTNAVSDTLTQSPAYATDPTGHVDIMTGMMRTNFDNAMGSSAASFRGRPRFGEFDTPNTRIGVDNPDTRYLSAHLPNADGQQIYRVWGNRSNSADMIILTNDASDPQGGGAVLEDEEMVNLDGDPLQLNDKYEVFLSTAELYDPSYMHNWIEITVGEGLNVSHRQTMCNYKEEKPGKLSVERLGTEGVSITTEEFHNEAAMIKGIARATAIMHNQQPFWGTIAGMIRNSPLPANFTGPFNATGGVGIQTQLSSFAYTDLEDDEALVVSYRTDTPAVYGSVQVFNDWGSSLPWGHASVNMNYLCGGDNISESTSDGLVHMVISKNDPGVHNWINTMDKPVLILNRLQGVDPAHRDAVMAQLPIAYGGYMPWSRVVKIADLATTLPTDTAWVTEKQRAKQIKTRQKYQRKKYGSTW